jgi:hypothetical protein
MIQLEEDRGCPPLISGFAFTPTNKAGAPPDAATPIMSGVLLKLLGELSVRALQHLPRLQ